jgi:hypothetical protein
MTRPKLLSFGEKIRTDQRCHIRCDCRLISDIWSENEYIVYVEREREKGTS